ncbi:hypothetical protein PQ469_13045 [Mucilaginibacter sp. KACC 22773]|jgi:hypothetical protein|uniref:hypothetical protein n=1 Tax=Mucilaginibacter sp. KACC 22773 TaxID=3025671 RepID=UPI002365CE5F|nr:hypothetical protein [Mucilaginibacter sp. KACC 22773]WDF80931.1 hypothetical protein PQ469_13045 [Mucilaginibacter sp. KACC 22773]
MKEKNENKLDQLFRDGLSGPGDHFAFREEDWESMEQLLDKKSNKKAGFFRIMYYASGIAALLLLALGLYFYSKNDTTDPAKSRVKVVNKTGNSQKHSGSPGRDTGNDSLNNKTDDIAVTAPGGQSNSVKSAKKNTINNKAENMAVNNSANNNRASKVKVSTGSILNDKATNMAASKVLPKNNVQKTETISKAIPGNNATQLADNKTPSANKAPDGQTTGIDTPDNGGKIAQAGNQVKNNIAANQNADTTANKKAEREAKKQMAIVKASAIKNRPQFSISVLAASDANAVNSFGHSQTGTNYGLQLSLRITKKLTISTGAAYAIKPYSSTPTSYSSASYNPSITPTNIQANCKVLDVPLNLSYQLYSKGSNAIGVGTGLSSYFMLKENYRFDYSAESGWKPYNLEIRNKNTHLFGVLNVNVNYQRRINSKFSAVLQPYMKLPITGIGNGKVDLKSTGVALGINWNIGSGFKP